MVQPHERFDDLPGNVRALRIRNGDQAMWASDLYGDFRVCPLTRSRPGRMQRVRLTGVSNLIVRRRG